MSHDGYIQPNITCMSAYLKKNHTSTPYVRGPRIRLPGESFRAHVPGCPGECTGHTYLHGSAGRCRGIAHAFAVVMCMGVCMHMCVCVCVYKYGMMEMPGNRSCFCWYDICVGVCMHACMYACLYAGELLMLLLLRYACVYVCMYVCVCVCV